MCVGGQVELGSGVGYGSERRQGKSSTRPGGVALEVKSVDFGLSAM